MFDSVFIMFLLALLPIIWLIVALCGFKLQAHIASVGACVIGHAGVCCRQCCLRGLCDGALADRIGYYRSCLHV